MSIGARELLHLPCRRALRVIPVRRAAPSARLAHALREESCVFVEIRASFSLTLRAARWHDRFVRLLASGARFEKACHDNRREGATMTGRDIAIEFTELWDNFDVEEINTMLAKNVSVELLEFFASYADQALGDLLPSDESGDELARRLPNLMIIGYIIRVLEERLVE
jgi:hypothetical protein